MPDIPHGDRLIVALDVATGRQAMELADRLGDQVDFYKIGLELFSSGTGIGLIETLVRRGHRIFADFKFFDVPATVSRSVRNLNDLGITLLTVHGDIQIMQAAVDAAEDISILAVTVLTSMDQHCLAGMGVDTDLSTLVMTRAHNAQASGCAGVIASGQEAALIRQQSGADFMIVTPGIRNTGEEAGDQRRTMSASDAIRAGADYLVVGRPIRDATDPRQAAAEFQEQIARALSHN